MKRIPLVFISTIAAMSLCPAMAAQHGATVTEAVNQVSHGSSQSADSAPAPTGTVLKDGEYLKTGIASRAEMELPNQTITRLGANTIFNYTAASNQVDLQAGTVLFSKPKDGQQLNIKTEAVTAAITGTTGFIWAHGHGAHAGYMFGLIEGKGGLVIGGTRFVVHAGELLIFSPGHLPQIVSFDVPLLLKTSPLFTKFGHDLPNEKYIMEEVALYESLVGRGFIKPITHPFFLFDYLNAPNFPVITLDSSNNQLDQDNNPPHSPTPPPSGSESESGSTCPPRCDPDRFKKDDRFCKDDRFKRDDRDRDRDDRDGRDGRDDKFDKFSRDDDKFGKFNKFSRDDDKFGKFDKFCRDDKFGEFGKFGKDDKFGKFDKFGRDDKFGKFDKCEKSDKFDGSHKFGGDKG